MAYQDFYNDRISAETGVPIPAKNSEVFHRCDPLTIDAGFLRVALGHSGETPGDQIIGWCDEDFTAAADNQTVAQYCPQYQPTEGMIMNFPTSIPLVRATHVGGFYDFTGASGAKTVDLSASGTQVYILGIDPKGLNETSQAIVECSKMPSTNNS